MKETITAHRNYTVPQGSHHYPELGPSQIQYLDKYFRKDYEKV